MIGYAEDNADYQSEIVNLDKVIETNPKDFQVYYKRGLAKYALKEYKNAIDDFSKAIEINPHVKEIYLERFRAFYYLNYPSFENIPIQRTMLDVNKALEIDPKYIEAYKEKAYAEFGFALFKDSIADYTKAIKLAPNDPELYVLRGNIKAFTHDYDSAKIDYEQALKIDSNYEQAKKQITTIPSIDEQNAYNFYMEGIKEYDKGNYIEAIEIWTQIVQNDKYSKYKDSSQYNLSLANLREYLKAIELYNQGYLFYEKQEYDKAINNFNLAINITQKYKKAYYYRGLANYNLKNYQEAKNDYDQVIKLDSKYKEVLFMRGNIYFILRNYQKAIVDYDKALEQNSQNYVVYSYRGLAKYAINDYKGAIEDYNQVIKNFPASDYYTYRAEAKYALGDYDGAIRDWEFSIRFPQDRNRVQPLIDDARVKLKQLKIDKN